MLTGYRTSLIEKKPLTSNTYLFTFKLINPQEIEFIAGQYLILKVEGKPRLYSIASSDLKKNTLEFIIQLFPGGLASTYLDNLKIGDIVEFQGPAGQFKLRENDKQKVFLVTGTGIAPVRSILSSNNNQKCRLFWGMKNYSDVYLIDEIVRFNPKICLSREKDLLMIPEDKQKFFDLGYVNACFFKQYNNMTIEQLNNFEYYLCGGRDVVESLRQTLLAKNIPPENIIFEKF